MVLTGGAVVLTFYLLVPFLFNMNVFLAAMTGALIITAYEFSMGVVVNLWLHWDVWDYSSRPGNVLGADLPAIYSLLVCNMPCLLLLDKI